MCIKIDFHEVPITFLMISSMILSNGFNPNALRSMGTSLQFLQKTELVKKGGREGKTMKEVTTKRSIEYINLPLI